ncbi:MULTISPECIES: hypothetical protein [Sorangium]|uniref:hypothetical protein n=1 Tax=Sorangium TaxID=39643 RepID=UPI00101A3DE3|nr:MULTISPECIES: hypothetical protein [Sorangium]
MQFKHHLRVELAGDNDTVFLSGGARALHAPRPPRFGPVRLHDAPVRLGWLDRANREGDLSPVPLCVQAALGRGDLPCATAIASSTRIVM